MKSRNKSNKFSQGFTLIELLVVVGIIAVLAAVVTVSYISTKAKSRDSKRISDLDGMLSAMRLYFEDTKSVPANVNNNGGKPDVCNPGTAYSGVTCLHELIDSNYLAGYPIDPKNSLDSTYSYGYFDYSSAYGAKPVTLAARMEAPRRYGPFPYGLNCSNDSSKGGAWAAGSELYCVGFFKD